MTDNPNIHTENTDPNRKFLQVNGLKKTFPTPGGGDVDVFEEVNFSLSKGKFVCIIGHSGCGKSTILNALAGLDTLLPAPSFSTARKSPARAWSAAWYSRTTA